MDKARVESFSDGVFAFAITLLVLGISVPELKSPSDPELRAALLHASAGLIPYVTSFATIGVIWLNHHTMFSRVQRVEHATLTMNLLLLLVVAFIPYPTAVLSRYGAMPSAAFFYGATMSCLGLSYTLLGKHLVRRNLAHNDAKHAGRAHWTLRNLIGTVAYPVAALLALWLPKTSVFIYFGLALFYFVPARARHHQVKE